MTTRRAVDRRPGRRDGERGSALVIVLAFVLITAVVLTALLREARANFASVAVTKSSQNRLYAANGGIDWGIQALRRGMSVNGSTVCASPGPAQTLGTVTMNGRDVAVSCQVNDGQTPGANGWAVFITDVNGRIDTHSSPSTASTKTVNGAVYNGSGFDGWSFASGTSLVVRDGDVVQQQTTGCTAPSTTALTVAPAPAFAFGCRQGTLTTPAPPIGLGALPDLTTATPQSPTGTTSGNCRVFTPGRYTSLLQFASTGGQGNYLHSGVYFLDDIGQLNISSSVVGGIPAPGDGRLGSVTPCATESAAETGGHYGVVIVLSGRSVVNVASNAKVELHSYLDPAQPGQPGLSVYQLRATDVGAWSRHPCTGVGSTSWSVQTALNSNAELIVHGHVYSPASRVAAYGGSGSAVSFLGGVVAAGLDLQANPVSGAANVSIKANSSGKRTITLTAMTNQIGREKAVSTTAIVAIANDAPRTATVQSWTVRN